LIPKSIINRRFIRIKAIQNLYAFYINQQADYQYALEEIKAAFIPDIFASIPADKEQLAQERDQAIALFIAWEAEKNIALNKQNSYSAAAEQAARKAWTNYKFSLAQGLKVVENGWEEAFHKIRNAYLLSIQLIIEWFTLAQQQAQKNKQIPQIDFTYPSKLANSHLLEKLKADDTFLQLIHEYNISWDANMDLVSRWYNQFIKSAPNLTGDTSPTNTSEEEKTALDYLVKDVLFTQEDIQNFFSDLDLSWEENKPIVKKLLHQTLTNLEIEVFLQEIKKGITIGENSKDFYNKLISTFIEHDLHIDQLIQQHINNWSMERIVLLDRIIIKLAICEMRHLTSIPVKVALNEYVELAKRYSTDKSGQFVNGVLDTIAKMV
jgi:N utilization substance protein B